MQHGSAILYCTTIQHVVSQVPSETIISIWFRCSKKWFAVSYSQRHRLGAMFTFLLRMRMTMRIVMFITSELFFYLKEYFMGLNVTCFIQGVDRHWLKLFKFSVPRSYQNNEFICYLKGNIFTSAVLNVGKPLSLSYKVVITWTIFEVLMLMLLNILLNGLYTRSALIFLMWWVGVGIYGYSTGWVTSQLNANLGWSVLNHGRL